MAIFNEDLTDEICERIAGGESLRTICESGNMPNKSTVLRWLATDEAFRDRYARARDAQADTFAEAIIDIADRAVPETANVARLQIDARKWMAGKLRPKVYGDKVALTGDPDAPLQVETITRSVVMPTS